MFDIKRQYIVDENNKRIAVQLDVPTFEKMEQLIENYVLAELIKENDPDEVVSMKEAEAYYGKLSKAVK